MTVTGRDINGSKSYIKGVCPDPSIIRAGEAYIIEILTDEYRRGFTGANLAYPAMT